MVHVVTIMSAAGCRRSEVGSRMVISRFGAAGAGDVVDSLFPCCLEFQLKVQLGYTGTVRQRASCLHDMK